MKNRKKILGAICILFCTVPMFAKKMAKSLNPDEAVRKLVPVVRKAEKPTEGVYYSLFVRSFADGNGDGIGDFKGLTKKLDYLNDGNDATTTDLGITGIWLLPIFESQSYHGYGVDDYYALNPEYGTMQDFEIFLKAAKKRGISVIIDMTCNHSSNYNSWFIDSRNPESEYRNWYRWVTDQDDIDGKINLKQKIWNHNVYVTDLNTVGKTTTNEPNMQYYAALFDTSMPDFNMDTQAVRDEFKKIFKFWMDLGVSGFRFDAAGHIYNIVEVPIGGKTLSKAVDFWQEMTSFILQQNPDSYNVAEVWEPTRTRAKFLAGMQSNFHFDLGTQIAQMINNQEINDNEGYIEQDTSLYNGYARYLENTYTIYAESNKNYIDAPFLSNHDQPRSAAALRNRPEKMKLAANLYILTEGVPFIYYGEELSMKSGADDPSKRTPVIWKSKGTDKNQTTWMDNPMYSKSTVYNRNTLSVMEQEKNPDSVLNHYKRVIRVKTSHPALFRGKLKAVGTGNPVLESYVMECDVEKAFVVHNISSVQTVTVKLPEGCNLPLVYASNPSAKVENGQLTIPSMSSVVLAAEK